MAASVSASVGGALGDLDQSGLAGLHLGEESALVLEALPGDQLELGILRIAPEPSGGRCGAGSLALGLHPIAPGREVALELGDEIAGGEAEHAVGGVVHRCPVLENTR